MAMPFQFPPGLAKERTRKTERASSLFQQERHARARDSAYAALDAFEEKEGLTQFVRPRTVSDAMPGEEGSTDPADASPVRFRKRPPSADRFYEYGQCSTRPRSLDAQLLERCHNRTMLTRSTTSHTFYSRNMRSQDKLLDPVLMHVTHAQKSKVPDLAMQKHWPIGYRAGDQNTGYVTVSETVDSHMLRRSQSMPLGKTHSGEWRTTTGLQTGLFIPKTGEMWTGANTLGRAATVIRPTRTSLGRSRHIQTALSELEDEEQREKVRGFNANHNGQWRDMRIVDEDPTAPHDFAFITKPAKKRTAQETKTLFLFYHLDKYLEKRRIRVKEMFQPYKHFGPGERVDAQQLLLGLRRFHLAEDLGRQDMLECMQCLDPTTNGSLLLTELARCLVVIRKHAPAELAVKGPEAESSLDWSIAQLEANAATARSHTTRSSIS